MAKKAYIGVPNFVPRELPEGYTQISHIESTGAQYINTGVNPSVDTRAVIDFQATSTPTSNWWILGAVTSGTVLWRAGVNASAFRTDAGFSYNQTASLTKRTIATGTCSINMSIPLYLFAQNEGGAVEFGKFKLYSCQLYSGDTLIRDYVPCINASNVAGLYDMVNGTFSGSASSTTFVAGDTYVSVARKIKKGYVSVENFVPRTLPSGYTQLSHIESTGAQYFDTGVVPAANLRLELAFIPSETGQTDNAMFGASWSNDGFLLTAYQGNVRFHSKGYYIDLTKNASGINTMSCSPTSVTINGVTHAMTGTGSDTQAYTIYLFWVGDQSSPNNKGHYKLLYCKMYAGETLIRDYVPSKNSNGVVGLYDMVNGTFGGSASSTAFVAGSSAQSVARKIKKAYISIGGVARPCWAGGELAYYGTITPLSTARSMLAATTVGNYALFGGGKTKNYSNTVDAYNISLTHTTPTPFSQSRSSLAATTIGNYALFGGGDYSSDYRADVDAYNTSLTRSGPSKNLYNISCNLAATTVGNYALFAGGYGKLSGIYDDLPTVNAYNTSLTRTLPTELSDARRFLAATTIGNYALFGGGGEPDSNVVDAYNASLTRTIPTALSVSRGYLAATTIGNYALFGGGYKYSSNVVDAYDTSLTRTLPTILSVSRTYLAATTVDNYAIFGGGSASTSGQRYSTVDAYDASLTRTTPTELNTARYQLAATTIGNYALFGGGYLSSTEGRSSVVDAYVVA